MLSKHLMHSKESPLAKSYEVNVSEGNEEIHNKLFSVIGLANFEHKVCIHRVRISKLKS